MKYNEFIESKIAIAKNFGFAVEPDAVHPILKPHQRDIVVWNIRGGCRAVFADFGTGKTIIQLETGRLITLKKLCKGLVLCPLGVKQEFSNDAKKLGVKIQYVRNDAEILACEGSLMMTNYERVRDGHISPSMYQGENRVFDFVTLDEGDVLRGFGTKTYQSFLKLFADVRYKFVATATPSPNRLKELIHYAGFLGIMDTGQALTRFFKRDPKKAGNLKLFPHKEKEFWYWVQSWAVFINKPSDLGYSDEGYILPPMKLHVHKIPVDHSKAGFDKNGQGQLYRDSAIGLSEASKEKRLTLDDRIAKTMEIIKAEPDRHFLLWHDLEDERRAIKKALPEAVEVYGSLNLDTREQRVIDFAEGKIKYLATKPRISGAGCNFQHHCSAAVFVGVGYKFRDFFQAIHRILRYLQKEQVDIHLIYAESEEEIYQSLMRKWREHNQLRATMTAIIKEHGLSKEAIKNSMARDIGVVRVEEKGELFTAVNNDCVEECRRLPDNCIDLIHTSIPFGNHYEYTPNYNDFGHNENNDRFFEQMDYLTPELLRILKPGRVAAIHVKDRVLFGSVTGYGMPSLDPFHMLTTFHFQKHGFIFFGMITIETDVVRENNQTYRLGYTENCKDGTKMGVGCPEYLLLFRKLPSDTSKAYADTPVSKNKENYSLPRWQVDAAAKWNSSGNRFLTPEEIDMLDLSELNKAFQNRIKNTVYNYRAHLATYQDMDAKGKVSKEFETLKVPARTDYVWSDINRMRTLNGAQSMKGKEQHICPLQFDIVERVIDRFSNPGETVLDPFGGVMTVPYTAVKMGRKGYGIELNSGYWADGVAYCKEAEIEAMTPDLFDLLDATSN